MFIRSAMRAARGVTLIEQIVFIVVVSLAVTAVLAALSMSTRSSADPMIQKQALAIAEAVMEEIQLQPFTYCDPDDDNAATATSAAGCAAAAEGSGAEAANVPPGGPAETRGGAARPLDNVNDYQGFAMAGGITDQSGAAVTGLDSYGVSVAVAGSALGGIGAAESLLISVRVTHPNLPGGVLLEGYRVRYAPNALP